MTADETVYELELYISQGFIQDFSWAGEMLMWVHVCISVATRF